MTTAQLRPNRIAYFLIPLFLLSVLSIGCRQERTEHDALDVNMEEELPGVWVPVELYGDLRVRSGIISVPVEITNENYQGVVTFYGDSNKVDFDMKTDITVKVASFWTRTERERPIDSYLSYEVIDNNYFRFYVDGENDQPLDLMDLLYLDEILFFAIEKSETEIYLKGEVDTVVNFEDEDNDDLPSGDLPTTGDLFLRLKKIE